jgi:gentisate 1,2-dioxygenase
MTPEAVQTTNQREAYYKEIAASNLIPLWERIKTLAPVLPRPQARPVCWRFVEIRPLVLKAGSLLSTEEAERRVLVLENPGMPGESRVADSLYAGVQLLMPGESAGVHRHTAGALRIVLEGSGAYTSVNGERTTMERGDFIVTPGWSWHAHGNDSSKPMIWMDGIDIPIVNLFNAGFFEHYDAPEFAKSRSTGDSEARYGEGGMLPENGDQNVRATPLLNYRYERARTMLADLHRRGPMDSCHGIKMRYVNGSPMPTLSAAVQFIPAGFETVPYRSTESTVFVAVEGQGTTGFDDQSFDWTENDIFVVPGWATHRFLAKIDTVLFSFSDRAAQEKLGIWREQRSEKS